MYEDIINEINENLPEKVVLVYRGVLKLCESGVDIQNVKVADIAKAAGIGKGTIYDYFSTKEEIIAKALAYSLNCETIRLRFLVKNTKGFCGKLNAACGWLNDNSKQQFVICHLLQLNYMNTEITRELFNQIDNNLLSIEGYGDIVEDILNAGIEEKILHGMRSDMYKDIAIGSGVMVLLNYLHHQEKYKEESYNEVKEYAYKLFLHIYNNED